MYSRVSLAVTFIVCVCLLLQWIRRLLPFFQKLQYLFVFPSKQILMWCMLSWDKNELIRADRANTFWASLLYKIGLAIPQERSFNEISTFFSLWCEGCNVQNHRSRALWERREYAGFLLLGCAKGCSLVSKTILWE